MYNAHRYNTVLYNYSQPAVQKLPSMIVRFAFGNNAFTSSPTWQYANAELISYTMKKGRQHEMGRMEAGVATIVLKNTDGRYWPNEVSSPHYPYVKPGVRVNIRAVYNGATYDRYTGYVESFDPGWLAAPNVGAITTVRCSDAIKSLSKAELNNAGYAQAYSGSRINSVLDTIGWPTADRDINTGQSLIVASGALANIKAMDHLFNVQDAEFGIIFIDGAGKVVFHDRHARFKAPLLTASAEFGAPGQKYADIVPSFDDEYTYNDLRRTRTGGTEQVSSSAASKLSYGIRTDSKQGLLVVNDNECLAQTGFLVNKYKDPSLRIKSIKIYPQRDPGNLWEKILSYDIGTKVTISLTEGNIDEDYHIEGISESADIRRHRWDMTWQLTKADALFWVLGQAGFSELGVTTVVGY